MPFLIPFNHFIKQSRLISYKSLRCNFFALMRVRNDCDRFLIHFSIQLFAFIIIKTIMALFTMMTSVFGYDRSMRCNSIFFSLEAFGSIFVNCVFGVSLKESRLNSLRTSLESKLFQNHHLFHDILIIRNEVLNFILKLF